MRASDARCTVLGIGDVTGRPESRGAHRTNSLCSAGGDLALQPRSETKNRELELTAAGGAQQAMVVDQRGSNPGQLDAQAYPTPVGDGVELGRLQQREGDHHELIAFAEHEPGPPVAEHATGRASDRSTCDRLILRCDPSGTAACSTHDALPARRSWG